MSNMVYVSLLSFVCLVGHLAATRNLATPGVAHGAVWLFVSLGYVVVLGELSAISPKTLTVLIVGIAAFSIGLHAGERITGLTPLRYDAGSRRFPIQSAIVVVSAIGLAMMLHKAFQLMPPEQAPSWFGGEGSWYNGLRNNLNNSAAKGSFGLPGYVLNFSFAGTAFLILFARRHYLKSWLWPSIALSLGFALLSTGRTHLVLLGCLVIAASLPTSMRKRLALALLLPLMGGAILVFVTWMSGRLDTTSIDTLLASVTHRHLIGYVLTPVGALDILVNSGLPATGGSMTFRTPLAVFRALGLPVDVPEMIQANVTVASFQVNVYTVFSPYYRDFGVAGVGLFMAALGAVHGGVFRQLKTGLPIIIVANAILFYALFMQFFQDQYFSLMSQWIQILGWTYIFNKLQPLPGIAEPGRQ